MGTVIVFPVGVTVPVTGVPPLGHVPEYAYCVAPVAAVNEKFMLVCVELTQTTFVGGAGGVITVIGSEFVIYPVIFGLRQLTTTEYCVPGKTVIVDVLVVTVGPVTTAPVVGVATILYAGVRGVVTIVVPEKLYI